MGIDLATEKGKSGICILNKKISTEILHTDEEIIKLVNDIKPKVIAIDAPLSMPKKYYRLCDMKVRKAGIPIFSFNLPALKKLAKRGIMLKRKLRNFTVIETYPYCVIKLNRKIADLAKKRKFKSKHERDAFICAIVAKNYARGRAKFFSGEGKIFY